MMSRNKVHCRCGEVLGLLPRLLSDNLCKPYRGEYHYPQHQTPWQEIQRGLVDEFSNGMVLKPAVKYQKIAKTKGIPRDNH